ncbi:MAG: hypothetical protein N2248_00130 [candidate division WOR-3 bacterium]|uniref:Uncharacterized protein n=2 Tax=candidate division WOR-3 bacterium TaxID=2052148 RepID=A0A7C1SHE3_UNCW3|nr:hypothetical protein [candidate division WOR-3 bacterium]
MIRKLTVALAVLLLAGISPAEEQKPELKPVASFVHPDAAGKLPILGTVAVVLSGIDPQANRLLEDALALGVLSESIRVIYPGEKELGKNRQSPPEPVEFARKLGANSLITGNIIARCGHCVRSGGRCSAEEMRAVSLALVDVPQDKVLVWALYEPESGTPVTAISQAFVRFMIESLKEQKKEGEQK